MVCNKFELERVFANELDFRNKKLGVIIKSVNGGGLRMLNDKSAERGYIHKFGEIGGMRFFREAKTFRGFIHRLFTVRGQFHGNELASDSSEKKEGANYMYF